MRNLYETNKMNQEIDLNRKEQPLKEVILKERFCKDIENNI